MQVNKFMGKFGALGTFLTGKNKSAPEANKTQPRAKLPKANNLAGDRCHLQWDSQGRSCYFSEAKAAGSQKVSVNEASEHSQGHTAQAVEERPWRHIRLSLMLG
jgi:hypothetical protein